MKVVLSGGGTGGHIYPALALAKIIEEKEPEAEFLYIGSFRGVEKQIVPKTNLPFMQLDVQGFSRSLSLTNFKTIYLFLKATAAAKKILKIFSPTSLSELVVMFLALFCMPHNKWASQRLFMSKIQLLV